MTDLEMLKHLLTKTGHEFLVIKHADWAYIENGEVRIVSAPISLGVSEQSGEFYYGFDCVFDENENILDMASSPTLSHNPEWVKVYGARKPRWRDPG